MTVIRRNIVANVIGGGWIIALNLLVIPFQVRILGPEAYGMLGLLATLQLVFSVLDLGAGATLVQRIAIDVSSGRRVTRELFASAIAIYGAVALPAAALLAANVHWLTGEWFRLATMPADVAANSLLLMFAAVLLRCPTLLCNATLSGINRLDVLNIVRAGCQTVRQLGGIAVLLASADLLSLLSWEVAVSAFELAISFGACKRLIPGLSPRPRLSRPILQDCWRYALGVNAIYLIALLLTQSDKLAISWLLPLDSLGVYYVAYNVTAWIALIQGGFNSAALPSMAADSSNDHKSQLRLRHNKITQLTVYTVTLPTMLIIFFAPDILGTWVDATTARAVAAVAAPLAAGFLLNAAVSNCLAVAIASGNSLLPLRINLAGLSLYLPALAALLEWLGIAGAAWAWIVLNAYYLFVMVPIVQRGMLQQHFRNWLKQNLLPFITTGIITFSAAKLLIDGLPNGNAWSTWVAMLTASFAYILIGYRMLAISLRSQITAYAHALRQPPRSA